jgi:UDP-galactopyranose mutase
MTRYDTVILGAGLCGLSAAYHLETAGDAGYLVIERDGDVGGLARTVTRAGFAFDHAIHILYTRDPYVADLISHQLLAGNLRTQTRRSYCHTGGIYTEYPYQLNNFGLPPAVVAENLAGFFAACQQAPRRGPAPDFETWIYQTYGPGIAKHFMIPYNRRQWAWDLREMAYDWIGDRVAVPTFADVLRGALEPPRRRYGPNREFWYPIEGGIQALARALVRRLPPERLWRRATPATIDAAHHAITLADGRRVAYRRLISTIPLPALVGLLGHAVAPGIRRAAAALKSNTIHTVNLGLQGDDLGPGTAKHWIYFPEEHTVFHRLSFPASFAPSMAPPGCSSIQAEVSESTYRPCRRETLVRDVLDGLVGIGILTPHDARPLEAGGRVRVADVVTLDPAYVIHDLEHRARTQRIKAALASWDIGTRGRFGEWAYLNMDHAILDGKAAAEERAGAAPREAVS